MANTESKKPFDLHLVIHAPNQGEQLAGLEHDARNTLKDTPDGKRIVVFTEHGRLPMQITNRLTSEVSKGKSPRAALTDTYASFHSWKLQQADVEDREMLKEYLDYELEFVETEHRKGFLNDSIEMVGRLASDFPKRVLWVPEGQTLRSDELYDEESALTKSALKNLFETPEEKAARRKLVIVYKAEGMREREEPNAKLVANHMAKDSQVAGFGWMGADHEGFGWALEDAGDIEVRRKYPYASQDMQGVVSPSTDLVLRLRRDPRAEVSDEEIKAAFDAERDARVITSLTMKPVARKIIAPFSSNSGNAERYRRSDEVRIRRERKIFDSKLRKLRAKHGEAAASIAGDTESTQLAKQQSLLQEPEQTRQTVTLAHDIADQEPQVGEPTEASIAQQEERYTPQGDIIQHQKKK